MSEGQTQVDFPSGCILLTQHVDADNSKESGGASGGLSRGNAIAADGVWMGVSELAPGHKSVRHHHDDQTTIVHILSGAMTFKVGMDGGEVFTARAGDFAVIPGGLVHQEENPSEELCRCVVVRNAQVPVVTNLE